MRKIFMLVIILVVIATVFAIQNSIKVPVKLFFWDAELSVAVIIVFSLATGAILGILFSIRGRDSAKKKEPKAVAEDPVKSDPKKNESAKV